MSLPIPGTVSRRARTVGSILALVLVLAPVAFVRPAVAQQGPVDVPVIDLGVFGTTTLATLSPSLLYRPFDHLSARPSAWAMGMGGAALARETSPLVVGLNPAGLSAIQSLQVSVDGFLRQSSGTASGYPDILEIPQQGNLFVASYDTSLKTSLRYGGAALAAPLWSNGSQKIVGGLFWRRFNEVQYPEETVQDLLLEQGGGFPVITTVDRQEAGVIEAYGPSVAVSVVPQLTVGANVNVLDGRLRSTAANEVNTGGGGAIPGGEESFTQKYRGVAFDVGAKVSLGDMLHLAGNFTPSHTIEVTGGQYRILPIAVPGVPAFEVIGTLAGYDLEMPSAYGAGVAFHPFDRLWMTADYNVRNSSEATLTYTAEEPADTPDPMLPLADMSSVHLGLEYRLFQASWGTVPVRIGYRQVPLGFRDINPEDYTYLLNPLSENVETIGILYSGTPTGDAVEGDAFTFGASADFGDLRYDLGVEIQNYELSKFYADSAWDPIFNVNPNEGDPLPTNEEGQTLLPELHPPVLSVDRTVTTIRFAATYRVPGFF